MPLTTIQNSASHTDTHMYEENQAGAAGGAGETKGAKKKKR
jgi:hypothetical protein